MQAPASSPAWLVRFSAFAPAKDVVEAWLDGLGAEGRADAEANPDAARTALRQVIVNFRDTCTAVRADASTGWKYTGSIMRAVDAAFGLAPAMPTALWGPKGATLHAPIKVVDEDGRPGTLGLYWGNVHGAARCDVLKAYGITHRLNVANECVRALPEVAELTTATVPMVDLQHEQMEDVEAACFLWAEQIRESLVVLREWQAAGAVVHVNCQAGRNRSGVVIAAWLCLERGWELLPAVAHLRSIGSLALGNPYLNVALVEVVGKTDAERSIEIPLNLADDGEGNWLTFSPPTTPKLGSPSQDGSRSPARGDVTSKAMAPEELARAAALKLEGLGLGPLGDGEANADADADNEGIGARETEDLQALADLADLFDED